MKRYYLTTPLYYVNAKPHIGHAYTTVAADCLARFKRLLGYKTLFLTGTDEHGQKIAKAAEEAGMEPKAFTDKMSAVFQDLWKLLDISYDDFIRTTEERHKAAVKAVWLDLQKKGEIYETEFTAWYCVPCERFLTDFEAQSRFTGTEEIKRMENESGIQQGFKDPDFQVICPDCKRPVERQMSEKNFFFKMSKSEAWLTEYIRSHEGFVLPQTRWNEVLGFLDNNKLEDLCVTRPKSKLSWGIECPLDPDYVTYVWFDALINYISACGYPNTNEWWPVDVHIVGKDILRHHAIFWPIILKALGLEPPRRVFAHGWWVQDKAKMSKSLGNVVNPLEVAAEFGVDGFRYFLLREVSFGLDGTYSEAAITLRYNTDLANDLGNLFYRTLTMVEKYHAGVIRAHGAKDAKHPLRKLARGLAGRMEGPMDRLQFHEALAEVWVLINAANKFIEDRAPWTLAKEKKDAELLETMVSLCEILRIVAQAVSPFIPETAGRMWTALGLALPDLAAGSFAGTDWNYFEADSRVQKGAPLFPRKGKENA